MSNFGRGRYEFGSSQYYQEVSTYADLPNVSGYAGHVYLVLAGSWSGLWYRRAGLYRSDGANWVRLAPLTTISDEKFALYDEGGAQNQIAMFECSSISAATTRTFTFPDVSGTLAAFNSFAGNVYTLDTAGITLTAGTLTAEQLTSTDDLSVTGTGTIGNIIAGTGTAGAPSYALVGCLDCGMYLPFTDVLGFATDGVLRFSITNTGVVSLGTITGTSFTIGANTLDTTEWAFLDGLDQALKTTDSPTFVGLTLSGAIATPTNITASGTLTAEQLTSTDDITMQGYVFSLGDAGAATNPQIHFIGQTNTGKLIWDESAKEFKFQDTAIVDIQGDATAAQLQIAGTSFVRKILAADHFDFVFGAGVSIQFYDSAPDGSNPSVRIYGFPASCDRTYGSFQVIDDGTNTSIFSIDSEDGYTAINDMLQVGGATIPVSVLEVNGAEGLAIETVTGNTTLDETHSTVLVNASGNVTITCPTAASAYNSAAGIGRIYEVKKIDADANTVTIDGNGAELIDGAATAVLTVQWESITFQSNGTSWYIL